MAKSKASEGELLVSEEPRSDGYGPERIDAAALRAYVAWGAHGGFRGRNGQVLPSWDDLDKHQQDAWRNAAFAVLTGG